MEEIKKNLCEESKKIPQKVLEEEEGLPKGCTEQDLESEGSEITFEAWCGDEMDYSDF